MKGGATNARKITQIPDPVLKAVPSFNKAARILPTLLWEDSELRWAEAACSHRVAGACAKLVSLFTANCCRLDVVMFRYCLHTTTAHCVARAVGAHVWCLRSRRSVCLECVWHLNSCVLHHYTLDWGAKPFSLVLIAFDLGGRFKMLAICSSYEGQITQKQRWQNARTNVNNHHHLKKM